MKVQALTRRAAIVVITLSRAAIQGPRAAAAEDEVPQLQDDEAPPAPPVNAPRELVVAPRPIVEAPRPRRPPGPPRRTAVYYTIGVGTPVGFQGLEAVHRFGDFFELSAGVGVGESAMESKSHSFGGTLQWSLMPRLRFGGEHVDFTIGAGVSGGQYGGFDLFGYGPGCNSDELPCTGFPTRYTLWGNLEIGGEFWSRGGFAVRYFFGLAHGMTAAPFGGPVPTGDDTLPYTGVGFGYAF